MPVDNSCRLNEREGILWRPEGVVMMLWKTRAVWLLPVVGAGILVCAYLLLHSQERSPLTPRDPLIIAALEKAAHTQRYAQEVRTEAIFPGRHLRIEGTYLVDRERNRYASVATTTVVTPRGTSGTAFTLKNISVEGDVYTQVSSKDPSVLASFGDPGVWSHFSATAIPEKFAGIAIPGPILDNLRILEDDGSYLSPAGTSTRDTKTGLTRYAFTLAPAHHGAPAGTLQALMGHIANGAVDVWVDDDANVRLLAFTGPDYRSTTTVSRLGEDLRIESPPASVVQ